MLNAVILRVLDREVSADLGDLRVAAPALAPDERVVLLDGLPPPVVQDHPGLAPVVLRGEVGGRTTYAERIPNGVRLSRVTLPDALMPGVVAAVLRALATLHDAGQVHGTVEASRVVLGQDGEVVLFGRGRRGAVPSSDVLAAYALLEEDGPTLPPSEALAVAVALEDGLPPDAVEERARWVREHLPAASTRVEQAVLTVHSTSADDSVDEIVPDLGSDPDAAVGLLDRWSVTTGSGRDDTDELTDGGSGSNQLALSLWSRLAAPDAHAPPVDRFREVDGVPSRGVRALLADDPPDTVPVPLTARVDASLIAPDSERAPALGGDPDGPTLHGVPAPLSQDFDLGDTAVSTSPLGRGRDAEDTTEPVGSRPVSMLTALLAATLGIALAWLLLQWF